nr:MAG TPA: hypothetical protein [Caudoviricetes sp.]
MKAVAGVRSDPFAGYQRRTHCYLTVIFRLNGI